MKKRMNLIVMICTAVLSLTPIIRGESISDYVDSAFSTKKDQVYAGELFDIFLAVRSHSVALDQEFKLEPIASPLLKQISQTISEYPVERVMKNNRVEEIRRFSWQAAAVSSGSINLSSSLNLSIVSRRTNLFFSRPERQYFTIPITGPVIRVLDLPSENRPENFSGAVGQFELSVKASPEEAAPGDVIRVTTEVSGRGIFDNIPAPQLSGQKGLKLYPPRLISSSPSLVYEQQVIPLTAAALTIPPISFSFFDPEAGLYRTLNGSPIQLRLRTGTPAAEDRFTAPDKDRNIIPESEKPGAPASLRTAVLLGSIIILLLIGTLHMRRSMTRTGTIVILTVLALLAATNALYITLLKTGYFYKNVYTMSSSGSGRIAPSDKALPTMGLPAGVYVEKLRSENGWALVNYSGMQSWIPETMLLPMEQ